MRVTNCVHVYIIVEYTHTQIEKTIIVGTRRNLVCIAWNALEFYKQGLCKDSYFSKVCILSIHFRLSKLEMCILSLHSRLSKHFVTQYIMFVLNSDLINT